MTTFYYDYGTHTEFAGMWTNEMYDYLYKTLERRARKAHVQLTEIEDKRYSE